LNPSAHEGHSAQGEVMPQQLVSASATTHSAIWRSIGVAYSLPTCLEQRPATRYRCIHVGVSPCVEVSEGSGPAS